MVNESRLLNALAEAMPGWKPNIEETRRWQTFAQQKEGFGDDKNPTATIVVGMDKIVYVYRDASNSESDRHRNQEASIDDIARMYCWSTDKPGDVEFRAVDKIKPFAFGVYAQLRGGVPLSKKPPVVVFWESKNDSKQIARVTINESWSSDGGNPKHTHQ